MVGIDISISMWIIAVLPIVVLLLLMVKFQWGAAEAAPVSLVIGIVTAAFVYKSNLDLIALESAKGIWSAMIVLIVVWPAILIFEVTNEARAFEIIRRGMEQFSPNKLLQILAIGWVFASFLQGVTGFGVPVAVVAPLLVGMGITPIWAVVIPLLGHAWANTFGTLSVAWQALVEQTGISGDLLLSTAFWASIFLLIFNLMTGIVICWFYGRLAAVKKGLPAVLIISIIHGGGQVLLAQFNQTIACFVPSCIAVGAIFLLGRTKAYREKWEIGNSRVLDQEKIKSAEAVAIDTMTLHQAFMPYYLLTGITLFVLLIRPVKNLLSGWKLGLYFPETYTAYDVVNDAIPVYSPLSPLTNSGTFLLVAAGIGYWYFKKKGRYSKGSGSRVLYNTIEKTVPSTIAVVGLIIMSKIMGGSGQTMVLAAGTAEVLGSSYALLAPAVGMLGSFMTSSNMASNILFADFQQGTSLILNLPTDAILGAQTAGGAIGNTISPGNVILGTTTAGILGKEGVVLKTILPTALIASAIIGFIVTAVVLLS